MRDKWREENREEVRVYNDKWRRANLKRACAHIRAYTLRKQRAMPIWANREAIQRFYEMRPEGMQVDHVIPLHGKLVSGLHVETNLQYLPGVENNRKGNRYAGVQVLIADEKVVALQRGEGKRVARARRNA